MKKMKKYAAGDNIPFADTEEDTDPFGGVRKPGGGYADVGSVSKEDTERDKREAAVSGPLKAKPKPKPKPKPAIVTKEQLAKSGYTTLRDYLNAQRGLKRRDGKKPVMRDTESKTASGMPREARGVKPTPTPAVKAGEDKTASGLPREARGVSRLKSDMAKAKEALYKFMSQSGKFGNMARGGAVKKGRRGDGCAIRGKTKGKMR